MVSKRGIQYCFFFLGCCSSIVWKFKILYCDNLFKSPGPVTLFCFFPGLSVHFYPGKLCFAQAAGAYIWNMPSICLSMQFVCVTVPKDLWHCMCCSDFISGNGAPFRPPALHPSPPSSPASPRCNAISLSRFCIARSTESSRNYRVLHPHRNQFGSILCLRCYSPIDSWDTVCILMSLLNGEHWQWRRPSRFPQGPFLLQFIHI